jgi:hypothetical protein
MGNGSQGLSPPVRHLAVSIGEVSTLAVTCVAAYP